MSLPFHTHVEDDGSKGVIDEVQGPKFGGRDGEKGKVVEGQKGPRTEWTRGVSVTVR